MHIRLLNRLRIKWSSNDIKRFISNEEKVICCFQNKIKIVALRTTNNINTLIKDLFRNPPSYKAMVNLSFKPLGTKPSAPSDSAAGKRPGITPITFQSGDEPSKPKKGRGTEVPIYSPPAGKFSEKAGQFTGLLCLLILKIQI